MTVEIKLTFMKINDIDTVDQQFQSEIFIQAKWEEPLIKEDEKVSEIHTVYVLSTETKIFITDYWK